ncbi:hypothetical protein Tco_0245683, partial [Tanacetum coccineum]
MLLCEWVLRPDGHPFDLYAVYSRFPTVFSLEIHHGDGFSVVEVTHMLAGLGYVNPKMEYWYKMPDKDALVPLSNDSDILRFTNEVLNVGEHNEVPNVGEHNEVPNVCEPNEVPNVVDQTEIPNDA